MDLRLNGQSAIVTGASRGIGLAVTRGLVAEGVHVTAGALKSSAELDELAGAGLVLVVEVDLAEPGGPARLVAAAGDRIDILVNNVGATSRWRTRPPWPRPTSSSSPTGEPRGLSLCLGQGTGPGGQRVTGHGERAVAR